MTEETFDFMEITLDDVMTRGVNALENALVDVSTRTQMLKEAFGDMAPVNPSGHNANANQAGDYDPVSSTMGLSAQPTKGVRWADR